MQSQMTYSNKRLMINFYQDQLKKFYKLGIGAELPSNIKVSDRLIDSTRRRMLELKSEHDSTLSEAAFRYRKKSITMQFAKNLQKANRR